MASTPTPKSTRSNSDNQFIVREEYGSEYGGKLFDILHTDHIVGVVKTECAFDRQFYADQSGPHKFIMQVHKVTNEYKQSEVQQL